MPPVKTSPITMSPLEAVLGPIVQELAAILSKSGRLSIGEGGGMHRYIIALIALALVAGVVSQTITRAYACYGNCSAPAKDSKK